MRVAQGILDQVEAFFHSTKTDAEQEERLCSCFMHVLS
jgi:hypothetical protein